MRRFGMLREVPAGQRELRQCEATAKLSVVSSVWTVLCTHGLDVLLSQQCGTGEATEDHLNEHILLEFTQYTASLPRSAWLPGTRSQAH